MRLDTTYMKLPLTSPIVVSACPLSGKLDNLLKMEDAGAGAVVLFSLFEEQIRHDEVLQQRVQDSTAEQFPEASGFFVEEDFAFGAASYLELIRTARERLQIPVIASLNGVTAEGWIDFARQIEEAGASGLELNIFFVPADAQISGVEVEQRYLKIVQAVRKTVSLPVAIKLNPYFSSTAYMGRRIASGGADALVLFNRFYEPDIDIERLEVLSDLAFSTPAEIRLPLLWIAALHGQVGASLAATTGVDSAAEVVKYLLAGADVVMTASSLYRHGIDHLRTLREGLETWMTRMNFDSLEDFRGLLSQRKVRDRTAYERANYLRILSGVSG